MSRSFGLRWHGLPLVEKDIELPEKLRVRGLTGGTPLWERAQIAWHYRARMSELDSWDSEDQDYALATWRTQQKVANIKVLDQARRS